MAIVPIYNLGGSVNLSYFTAGNERYYTDYNGSQTITYSAYTQATNFNSGLDIKHEGELCNWDNVERDLVRFSNGTKITIAYRFTFLQNATVRFYDSSNNVIGNINLQDGEYGVISNYITMAINTDNHTAILYCNPARDSNRVYISRRGSSTPAEWSSWSTGMYDFLIGNVNIEYNYQPITYLVAPSTHTHLAQIKAASTNHGEETTAEISTAIKTLGQAPNFSEIVSDMAIDDVKPLYRVGNLNASSVKRVNDVNDIPTYEVSYLIGGTVRSGLTQTYSIPSGVSVFASYLIDTEHNLVRPSFIFFENGMVTYNTETVSVNQQSLWFEWVERLSTSPDIYGYMLTDIDNPYYFGGDSTTTDVNNGTFDSTSENIPIADVPAFEITSSGFIKIFSPTKQQISDLSEYMWGEFFDLDTLKKLFANPMDCILNLSVVPCIVSKEQTPQVLKVGNVSTGISLDVAASQYVTINCGDIELQEFYGGYLDYAPYTKVSVYLPYIATVNLDTDEVMGKTINITYKIDILTGACIATIKADDAVLYHFSGTCGVNIPLTSQSYNNTLSNIVGIAGTVAGAIATKGSSVVANSALAVNTANAVMTSKADIAHSGSFGSVIGFMDIQRPYLIIEIPRQCKAKNQESYKGLPSHVDFELSALSGYTEIETIHLENMSCTDAEINEIEMLLQSGVIF